MEVIIFIYNIFLIILYSIAFTLSIFYYFKTKQNCYFVISILFALYLFDDIVIYMTEFIDTFSISYNNLFISVPTYKTLIIVAIITSYITINNMFLDLKNSKIWYFALGFLTIFLFLIPVMQKTALKFWIFFVTGDIFFIFFNIYILNILNNKKITGKNNALNHYKKLLKFTFLMSCLVFLEDSFVIFNIDVYSDITLNITNRNFSEDFLRIGQSVVAVFYLFNLLFSDSKPNEEMSTLSLVNDYNLKLKNKENDNEHDYYIFHLFCETYLFTIREQEIFKHLLEDKNNKLISESLYISIGTVKTHVHNIFIKTDVSNRRDLAQMYNQWAQKKILNSENKVEY